MTESEKDSALIEARATIRAALVLHREVRVPWDGPSCSTCGDGWPCPTSIILSEGLTP